MTKLPDDEILLGLYREGLSDKQIAQMYGVTFQGVNYRLGKLGIQRFPEKNTAAAIFEAAYPANESRRSDYIHLNRARELFAFMRWRLGDRKLTAKQVSVAKKFAAYVEEHDVVLSLVPTSKAPWVWLPREPTDGRLVLRWPAGRELPKGPHLAAITLPDLGK
ncbi:hypothetical protein ACR6C2_16725 [Streptomyces sp. INA 01156]